MGFHTCPQTLLQAPTVGHATMPAKTRRRRRISWPAFKHVEAVAGQPRTQDLGRAAARLLPVLERLPLPVSRRNGDTVSIEASVLERLATPGQSRPHVPRVLLAECKMPKSSA